MTESEAATHIVYSVVIPVYRAGQVLDDLLARLGAQMDELGQEYEIVMVEDHGGDDSWQIMEAALQRYPRLRLIRLMRNFGQHNALMCGFSYCRGDIVITMDDDLQNPPEEIPKLIAKLEQGFDVVYGVPAQRQHNPFRNLGSFLVRWAYKKLFNSTIDLTSFRIMRQRVVEGIVGYDKNYTFIDGLIAWHTSSIGEVAVAHHARSVGASGYSLSKLFNLAMNMLTNFSIIPLQFVSAMGVCFSVVGFLLAVGYLLKYLFWGIPVPGYTSIIIGITLFSGVQMLSLGLIGEYLGRIHLNINSKPQYFVRQTSFDNNEARDDR